jgi:hypothetical protein
MKGGGKESLEESWTRMQGSLKSGKAHAMSVQYTMDSNCQQGTTHQHNEGHISDEACNEM